jgi:hypothetical protein
MKNFKRFAFDAIDDDEIVFEQSNWLNEFVDYWQKTRKEETDLPLKEDVYNWVNNEIYPEKRQQHQRNKLTNSLWEEVSHMKYI